MQIGVFQCVSEAFQQRADILRRAVCRRTAAHLVPLLPDFFLINNARHGDFAVSRRRDRLQIQQRALIFAIYRQPMHHANAVRDIRLLLGVDGVMPALHHPRHVLWQNHRALVHLCQTRAHLHNVHRVASAGGIAPDGFRLLLRHRAARAFRCAGSNQGNFFRCQRTEKDFHAPRAQSGADF